MPWALETRDVFDSSATTGARAAILREKPRGILVVDSLPHVQLAPKLNVLNVERNGDAGGAVCFAPPRAQFGDGHLSWVTHSTYPG